jgi:hypothetical protein
MRSKPEVSCTIVNVTPGLLEAGLSTAKTGDMMVAHARIRQCRQRIPGSRPMLARQHARGTYA